MDQKLEEVGGHRSMENLDRDIVKLHSELQKTMS